MVRVRGPISLVVLVCLLVGCGTESATLDDRASTTPTTTTIAEGEAPEGLPRFVFGFIRSKPYPNSADPSIGEPTRIVRIDRLTGAQLELVSESRMPESLTGGATVEFAGLDVSPDGTTIVFSAGSASHSALYRIPADGQGDVELIGSNQGGASSGEFRAVRFSPDGQWVAVASAPVVAFPVDGGAPVTGTANAGYADERLAWSPDGSQLALSSHYERPGSGGTSVLSFDAAARTLSVSEIRDRDSKSPWWDDEGRLYVLPAGGAPGQRVLTAADADGSYEWVLGVERIAGSQAVVWWLSSEDPPSGRRLPGSFPANFVPMAW